jgi:hypothetical protein
MAISEWNDTKTTLAFPPEHVVVQGCTAENDYVGRIDFQFDSQVGETNESPLKRPHSAYAVISQVTGELILVRLGWQLVSVNSNVEPMRGVDPHKRRRRNLCPVHHFPLEAAVSAHGAKVNAIRHTIDGVQDWINGRKEVVPSGHVFRALHVAGKRW